MEETQTTLQHALFQSLMKSQNPFSKMNPACAEFRLLEKKVHPCGGVAGEKEAKCCVTQRVTVVRPFVLGRNIGCGNSTEGSESITDSNTVGFFSFLNIVK